MKIKKWKHEGVKPDGTFENQLGAVNTEPIIRRSAHGGGCNISTCKCSEGYWIMMGMGRTDEGIVEGITVHFDNYGEYQLFLTVGNLEEKLTNLN